MLWTMDYKFVDPFHISVSVFHCSRKKKKFCYDLLLVLFIYIYIFVMYKCLDIENNM